MSQLSESQSAREGKLELVQERLLGAVGALVSGDDWRRAMEFAAQFRARSFNNTLLIWAQHLAAFEVGRVPEPSPSYLAGFKQWQSLGRTVLKGQAGYLIQAPVTLRFATANPQDAGSWRQLGRFERPHAGEVVRARMVGVKPAYVWDVSQTAGDPVPERPRPHLLRGVAPAGLWEGLVAQVEAHGFAVRSVEQEGAIRGANGLTDYAARTVSVRQNMDAAAQVKTLAHELAHVLLHGPENPQAALHRGIAEIEAESVALMVAGAHSLDTADYTVPYVASWATSVAGKSVLEVVQATGERARHTAIGILEGLPVVPDGDPPGLRRELGLPRRGTSPASMPVRDAGTGTGSRNPASAPGL